MFRLLAFITAAVFAIAANAQSHDDARHRLVSLSVTSEDPETGIRNIASTGTGFFISADGFILTTEHILDAHRKKDGNNTIIKGRIGGTNTEEYVVKFVSEERNLDLLLLRAILPFGTPDPSPFKLGATTTISPNTGTQFKSSGFANGAKWTFEDGSFIDMDNETGYGWRLKMAINQGQSGSPVYLEDGETVIGILKGSHKDILDESIMIPIEYAMPLIGHVKIAALEEKIEELNSRAYSGTIDGQQFVFLNGAYWAELPISPRESADLKIFLTPRGDFPPSMTNMTVLSPEESNILPEDLNARGYVVRMSPLFPSTGENLTGLFVDWMVVSPN